MCWNFCTDTPSLTAPPRTPARVGRAQIDTHEQHLATAASVSPLQTPAIQVRARGVGSWETEGDLCPVFRFRHVGGKIPQSVARLTMLGCCNTRYIHGNSKVENVLLRPPSLPAAIYAYITVIFQNCRDCQRPNSRNTRPRACTHARQVHSTLAKINTTAHMDNHTHREAHNRLPLPHDVHEVSKAAPFSLYLSYIHIPAVHKPLPRHPR